MNKQEQRPKARLLADKAAKEEAHIRALVRQQCAILLGHMRLFVAITGGPQ